MQSIDVLRKTIANLAARSVGSNRSYAKSWSGQRVGELFPNTVLSLPGKATSRLQDLTAGSSTYGQFYFIVGYDPVGGGGPVSP